MFLETVRQEGLAQLSYVFGDGGQAAVIDPRRDVDVYLRIARRKGAAITHIFETHRNEDFVIGSCDLARRTGAAIRHGAGLPFEYGQTVREGDEFSLGGARLRVLQTPGHTDESISIVLSDAGYGGAPVAVFSGDALFVGDVGRTDFYPDRPEEVAALLYSSITQRLLPLGDGVLLCPAHGAGSVCGIGMADRDFSTLGYERAHNPLLQVAGEAQFVARKVAEHHYRPPYFRKMEQLNLAGPPPLDGEPEPPPIGVKEFARAMEAGMTALDVRSAEAFAGAHVPDSLSLPEQMIPSFAGWLLSYDAGLGLVAESPDEAARAALLLARLGYDRVRGYLSEGIVGWETSGRSYASLPALYAGDLKRRIDEGREFTLLDVRTRGEFERARVPGATHIYVGELAGRLGELPADRPVITFCGNGRRATVAASLLRRHGVERVEDCLGSMAAWSALGCPTEKGKP
jgi:hydroxyacylglutathione hydrolase